MSVSTKNVLKAGFALCVAVPLASCAHAAPAPTPADTTDTSATNTPPPAPAPKPQLVPTAADQPAEGADTSGQHDLEAAVADLKNVSVFFGFNDAVLTDDARKKLSAIGDVLVKHPTLRMKVEGNCDERGTEAYNLVLGQQRANSARKYLEDLGAKSNQIETVSYGAEKPKDPGHNDAAWQENRRDDVVVTSPGTK